MSNFDPNTVLGLLRGKLGGLVFVRTKDGKMHVRQAPVRGADFTAGELITQSRFKAALAYVSAIRRQPEQYAETATREFGMLHQAVLVKMISKDHIETSIGAAQKDTLREWAGKAANMQPVMWAGVVMMTLVAGALLYFGWWTKAALAAAVGLTMIVVANTLPDHGAAIVLGGLGTFSVVALLILYSYHKGQLDRNHNGIPDLLERHSDVPFGGSSGARNSSWTPWRRSEEPPGRPVSQTDFSAAPGLQFGHFEATRPIGAF